MFRIDYNISKQSQFGEHDIARMDELDLRYTAFAGSVYLVANDFRINLDWEWIPLLDFAAGLCSILTDLVNKEKCSEDFEFTESDAVLSVQKNGSVIELSIQHIEDKLRVSTTDFDVGVRVFCRDLIVDLMGRYPTLENNLSFQKIHASIKEVCDQPDIL